MTTNHPGIWWMTSWTKSSDDGSRLDPSHSVKDGWWWGLMCDGWLGIIILCLRLLSLLLTNAMMSLTSRFYYNGRSPPNSMVMEVLKSVNLEYNTLSWWVDEPNDSATKHLMFQVLFFFIISCKILCKNRFNLFSYFFI